MLCTFCLVFSALLQPSGAPSLPPPQSIRLTCQRESNKPAASFLFMVLNQLSISVHSVGHLRKWVDLNVVGSSFLLSTCASVYQEVASLGVKNMNSFIWGSFCPEITLSYNILSVSTIKIDGSGINQVVNSERKRKMDQNRCPQSF